MIVEIVKGYIEEQQTDVIVNTTTANLTLCKGEVSRGILQAAGEELQTECKVLYPKGIKRGDVAVTKGGKLNCKFVYHVVLPHTWMADQEATIKHLQSVVDKCLQTADDAGHKSISFPLLGTGKLQYPCNLVTDLIWKTASFFKTRSLEIVKIAVLPTCRGTKRSLSEMEARKELQETSSPECSPHKSPKKSNIANTVHNNTNSGKQMCIDGKLKETLPRPPPMSSPKPSTSQTADTAGTTSHIDITMVPGNIVHQKTSVGAMKMLQKRSSPECSPHKSLNQLIKANTAHSNTNAGNQMCIYGKSKGTLPWTPSLSNPQPSTSQTRNNAGTASQINIAMVQGNIVHQEVDVIVLSAEPNLSFGRENMRKEVVQTAGISVQEETKRKYPNGLKYEEIGWTSGGNLKCKNIFHAVLPPFKDDVKTEKVFKTVIHNCLVMASLLKRNSIAFPLLGCGTLKYPVDNVTTWLCESVQTFEIKNSDGFIKEVQIVLLSTHVQRNETQTAPINLTLEVGHTACTRSIMTENGWTHDWRVFVRGFTGFQVDKVVKKVVFNLHQTYENPKISIDTSPFEVSRGGYGGFLLPIDIYTADGEDVLKKTVQYPLYLNKHSEPPVDHVQLETLVFNNPDRDFRQKLLDAGGILQKKNDQPTSSVIAEFPVNWRRMEQEDFFKIVPLQPGEEEYREVANSFSVSPWKYTIVSIERIQNRPLYLQYQVMRKLFESRNPGIDNEQTLWHGTSAEATTSINMHGFNRSYCGKNATAFGRGVYFARKCEYSAQDKYSPKDGHDLKRMYQARVLTGQFTKGHSSNRVPPAKDPSKPHDRFDCVVDDVTRPNMFVIFQDAQAYPTYLITFK